MNIKNFAEELFQEMIEEYENKKMIQNKGIVKKTTAKEFLGGLKNV